MAKKRGKSANWFKNNALSFAIFLLFFGCLIGQSITGFFLFNHEQQEAGMPAISFFAYLGNGAFLNAMFTNWQAALLQLMVLILFAVLLKQKGSPHSRQPEKDGPRKNEEKSAKDYPFPQNIWRWLYENSLSLSFVLLFLISFFLHIYWGYLAHNLELERQKLEQLALSQFLVSPWLWFQNFQTWQAEFIAIGAYLVLSIFTRQKGSAESKPVDESNQETGESKE
jgi:hypothetical protein